MSVWPLTAVAASAAILGATMPRRWPSVLLPLIGVAVWLAADAGAFSERGIRRETAEALIGWSPILLALNAIPCAFGALLGWAIRFLVAKNLT